MDFKRLSASGLVVALGLCAPLAAPAAASASPASGLASAVTTPSADRVCAGGAMGEDSVLCLAEPAAGTAVATFHAAELYVRPGAVFMLQDQAPGGATLISPSFPINPNSHYHAKFDLSGRPAGHTWCLSMADDQFYDTFGPGPVCRTL